jgi:bifunctional DNA-binding transcriptional regulator/antitoxin component of YhaV-PrlF toxin-antitoxin module
MIQSEFERAKKDLKQGDCLCLIVRGNYGDYEVEGYLTKMENGRIYLAQGKSHHYLRIKSMTKIPYSRRMELVEKVGDAQK